ncbi:MAG: hypothetical protein AB8B49_11570 [Nitratireductor sp.]
MDTLFRTIKRMVLAFMLILLLPLNGYTQTDQQAISAFEKADMDDNGALNKTEFQRFIKAVAKLGNKNAARAVRFGSVGFAIAFRDADQNKNGSVTIAEVQTIR